MNKDFLEKMKKNLIDEKNEILLKSYADEEIDFSGDETDEIQARIIVNINSRLDIRNKSKISQIDNALLRLEKNEYGLCEDCGDEISEKRLLINPYFSTCISCAEQRELDSKK